MSPAPSRSRYGLLLRGIGLVLMAALLAQADVAKLLAELRSVELRWVVAAMLLNVGVIGLKARRWQSLMAFQGIRYGNSASLIAYAASVFIGVFTPGRLGEAVRSAYVSHDTGNSMGKSLANVLVDRLCDVFFLALATGLGLLFALKRPGLDGLGGALAATALAAAAAIAYAPLAGPKGGVGALASWSKRWLPFRHLGEEIWRGLVVLRRAWLGAPLLWTAAAYSLTFVQGYWLARAAGLSVSFLMAAALVSAASFIGNLPISVMGLGSREAALIYLLGPLGVGMERILVYSLLLLLVLWLFSGVLGGLAWLYRPAPLALLRPERVPGSVPDPLLHQG